MFLAGEAANLYNHIVLRRLRPKVTVERHVPKCLGFNWVTSPNYKFKTLLGSESSSSVAIGR